VSIIDSTRVVEVTPAETLAHKRHELRRETEATWRSCRVTLLGKGVFTHKGRKFCPRMKFFVVLVLMQIVFSLGKSLMDI
jgi:hypothetical protein